MHPRLYLPPAEAPITGAGPLALPAAAARHVQVLRLRAGAPLTVFDGLGGEWDAELVDPGTVRLARHDPVEREAPLAVTLAVGMPANDRMDALVEKAAELGAQVVQPLITQRSVLRLEGDRAARRVAHWQAIAVSACEQCGRNRLPVVAPVRKLADWLAELPAAAPNTARWLLSPRAAPDARPGAAAGQDAILLSGPEGGWTESEENLALAAGFRPASLGPRVLRADTAPLAGLLHLTCCASKPYGD